MDWPFWLEILAAVIVQACLLSAAFVFGCCWYRNWLCEGCDREHRGLLTRRETWQRPRPSANDAT